MRLFKFLIIYSILIIYSLEILLFFYIPEKQKSMVQIKKERINIAKKNNLQYDLRSPTQFYIDEKKNNKNLEPKFFYAKSFSSFKVFQEAKKNKKLIPFRGPINKNSTSCAEDLIYRIYENDKYGFKNSNKIYEKKINTFLLGDSYAEGLCVNREEDIAGNLNSKEINTINFGVTDTGPLVSLAILREFGEKFKPKNVVYLYFEGNDLDDLNFEKNETNLPEYLDVNFKLDYLERYDEIFSFLDKAKVESENRLIGLNKDRDLNTKKITESYLEHIQDIAELNNIRNIIRYSILKKQKKIYDLDLFFSIVNKMKFETSKWQGNFYFVYVPSWSRYFTKFTNADAKIKLKDDILKNLKLNDISVLDLTDFFDNSKNIEQYFPLGYLGHYNARGYAKIAEIIAKNIN